MKKTIPQYAALCLICVATTMPLAAKNKAKAAATDTIAATETPLPENAATNDTTTNDSVTTNTVIMYTAEEYNAVCRNYDDALHSSKTQAALLAENERKLQAAQETIAAREAEIAKLNNELAQFANNLLYIPYEQYTFENAVPRALNAITDADVLEKGKKNFEALRNYKNDIESLRTLINALKELRMEPASGLLTQVQQNVVYKRYQGIRNGNKTYLGSIIADLKKMLEANPSASVKPDQYTPFLNRLP